MGDLKVVATHREGDRMFRRWSDGAVLLQSLITGEIHDVIDAGNDPDGHVWAAITGSQGRTASTVSPDSPELAALREIDRALQAVWDVALECWLNEQTALYVIREAVDRALQARS